MKRFLLATLVGLLAAAAILFVVNSSRFAPQGSGAPTLIAHRGLGQTFSRDRLTGETCTAAQMLPPEHAYIENTIAGFEAAFAAGADIVEFDVQPTADGAFVIFHDWTLDCRTDGKGRPGDHRLAELKRLDIGYGYTADGGRTYPFRGQGVGLMPTLDEVLDRFFDRRFMINIKSRDPGEGSALAGALARRDPSTLSNLIIYGAREPLDAFAARLSGPRLLVTDNIRRCMISYLALGWSGYVPAECRHSLFMLPLNIAPWTWGYPNRLAARLATSDTEIILLGAYDGSGFSSGIDTAEEFAKVPELFDGAVWTNRIDLIGPLAR